MRKLFGLIAVFLACGTILLFFVTRDLDRLAALYTRKAMLLMQTRDDWPGFRISRLECGSVRLSRHGLEWRDVDANLSLKDDNRVLENKLVRLHIDRVEVRPVDLIRQQFSLRATGLDLTILDGSRQDRTGEITRLEQGRFGLRFRLALPDRDKTVAQLRELIQDLTRLRTHGYTTVPISFSGQGTLVVHATPVPVSLSARQDGKKYALVLDLDSLRTISNLLEEELTEPEVSLLARVPFLTPELLAIRDEAVRESKRLHREQGFSEDAYRHVLWSYLLTRRFGPDLAKEVTDAHELGLTDNTEADHRMDYRNNEVGRRYALNGLPRDRLPEKFRSDPAIIRSPEQAR